MGDLVVPGPGREVVSAVKEEFSYFPLSNIDIKVENEPKAWLSEYFVTRWWREGGLKSVTFHHNLPKLLISTANLLRRRKTTNGKINVYKTFFFDSQEKTLMKNSEKFFF